MQKLILFFTKKIFIKKNVRRSAGQEYLLSGWSYWEQINCIKLLVFFIGIIYVIVDIGVRKMTS